MREPRDRGRRAPSTVPSHARARGRYGPCRPMPVRAVQRSAHGRPSLAWKRGLLMACAGCNQERVMIAMKIMQRRVCDKDMQAARVILARTRFDTRGIESLDLKISKVMPKC